MTLAVAQMNTVLADIDANVRTHKAMIAEGLDRGVDLLVFPELSLTGYGLGAGVLDVAMPATAAPLADLAALAGPMTTIVGFVEDAGPGRCYNAAAILRTGRVLAVHRKVNLPTYGGLEEGKWFHKGTRTTMVEVSPEWRASTLICADLWNPAMVHRAMTDQPELLAAPANSASGIVSAAFSNEENWALALRFYAMIYATPILFANRYGFEGDSWFWGGSAIYGPRGQVLAEAGATEGVTAASLDRASIARARFDLPTHRDSTAGTATPTRP